MIFCAQKGILTYFFLTTEMGLSPDQQFFSLDQILNTFWENFPEVTLDSSTLTVSVGSSWDISKH